MAQKAEQGVVVAVLVEQAGRLVVVAQLAPGPGLEELLKRANAAGQGKELWQLIREISADTMSKFVAANAKGEKRSAAELKAMDYDQLQALYRKTAAEAIKEGKTLYELLRAQLPVYPV